MTCFSGPASYSSSRQPLGALCFGEPARRSGFLRFAVTCFLYLAPSLCGATGTTSCCGSRTRFPSSTAAFPAILLPARFIFPARILVSNLFRIMSWIRFRGFRKAASMAALPSSSSACCFFCSIFLSDFLRSLFLGFTFAFRRTRGSSCPVFPSFARQFSHLGGQIELALRFSFR